MTPGPPPGGFHVGIADAVRAVLGTRPDPAVRPDSLGAPRRPSVTVVVLALIAASALLRIRALDVGYWTDESIALGIAGQPLSEIPSTLSLDGSPPLYYLVLHLWTAVFGVSEAATRSLSLLAALAAIPAALWAGRALFGPRGGWVAAVGAAGAPFLTQYAQETRMYSMVATLSVVASAAFVLAFLHGRRRHLVTLAVTLTALLYLHNWALFLVAAMSVAWIVLRARGRVDGRDGPLVLLAVALAYAPWIPSLVEQARHTAAPWALRPSVVRLVGAPATLFGVIAVVVLAAPIIAFARRRAPGREVVMVLYGIGGLALLLAWTASQVEPAWAARYLAIIFGPLLLAGAGALTYADRRTLVAMAAAAGSWVGWAAPGVKSNVRAAATVVTGQHLRSGDVVLATSPELVPNLAAYLPPGLRYITPIGEVPDPAVTDWRDVVARMRRAAPGRTLELATRRLPAGGQVVFVTPVREDKAWNAPLRRLERRRGHELAARLAGDRRFTRVMVVDPPNETLRSKVRVEVYRRRAAPGGGGGD